MTVPTGAKIIKNKFTTRCFTCRQQVEAESGAAVLVPPNIKWAAHHVTCLPAPFEEADIPANITINVHHGPHRPVAPGHERCSICQHWQTDHVPTGCIGSFRGAGSCACNGFITPTVHTLNTSTSNSITIPTSQTPFAPVISFTPPDEDEPPEAYLLKMGRGTTPRLVVFAGPMGGTHVSLWTVLGKHGLSPERPPDCTIAIFVGANLKGNYRPQPHDFIMGPRSSEEEYTAAKEAFVMWLLNEGITLS